MAESDFASLDEIGEPGEHGYGGDVPGDPYGGQAPEDRPVAVPSHLVIGSQKGGGTTKGGLNQDVFPDVYGVRNIQPFPTPAPTIGSAEKEWSTRLDRNIGGVGYAKAGIQQAYDMSIFGGPQDKEETSLLDKAESFVDDFSSKFSIQTPVAPKGTIATDYGINKDITADPEEIASHREMTEGDKLALAGGIALASFPPNPITTPIGIARAWAVFEDRMKAKGVEGYAKSRDIDTTKTMNYGTPETVGVSPEYITPPSFDGVYEDRRIVKTPKTGTFPRDNEVQLAVAPPPTRTGATRAQMRRSSRGRARGYA